jgi:hypothetical protein
MRRAIRPLVTFCLLITAACAAVPPPSPVGARDLPLQITSSPLPLKLGDPQASEVGKLKWRGGIAMTANSRNFGGWSDLQVSADGRKLVAISDEGSWLTADIDYLGEGNLAGLSNGQIGSLRGLDGQPLADKQLSDAEGLAAMPDGSWIVSFERQHRIWRYTTLDAVPTALNLPEDFARQPVNGGPEALFALKDGRIAVISEEMKGGPGARIGWIGEPAGSGRYRWDRFDYVSEPDFAPTAIRQLPDGSFVTLERAFDFARGVRCRVMRFDASQLKPDGTVKPQELARLASPYAVDNLEGLSVTHGARGETLLWLMSDDNFNPVQRNILLLFELLL